MTDSDDPFETEVTPPHRPRELTTTERGEETVPVYAEERRPSFGEGSRRPYREALGPPSVEGETSRRSGSSTSGRRTSAFILGGDRADR